MERPKSLHICPKGKTMQQGFVFFHAACNHQRHLMIAVECLLRHMEDQKNGLNSEAEELSEKLMEELVDLSKSMTADMENFTLRLFRNQECLKTSQQFIEIENACHQLLDANLYVVDCALDVANRFGFAERVIPQLKNIAVRTKLIQAQLREFAGTFFPLPSLHDGDSRKFDNLTPIQRHF